MVTKRCPRCKETLPLSEFYKSRSRKDGFQGWCKSCKNACDKAYRQTLGGKAANHKSVAKYQKTPKGKIVTARYQKSSKGKAYRKQYCQEHKPQIQQQNKQYRETLQGHLRNVWLNMLRRCNNTKHKQYKDWGGRGIQVKFASFDDFHDYIINELKVDPRGLTIDRIDNDGHYEAGNIRFVSQGENNRNRNRKENNDVG